MTVHWLTTAPNPRYISKTCQADDGQRGWRQHAVLADNNEPLASVGRRQSLCGLRPGTGWGLDLFIETKCKRCLRATARLQRKRIVNG